MHGTIGALVLLFVPVFIALCVFTQTVFIDRNPQSDMLGAKVQGRVEGVMILAKVALVIAFTAVVDIIPPLATLAVCAATSALWVYLLAVQQPFIVPSMNDLRCGYGAIFAWGTVMGAYVIADPNTDLGIMTLLGVPLAFGLGWYLSLMYRESIAASPLKELTSWYDVDMWARYRIRLRDVLNKEAKRHGMGVAAVHDIGGEESALAVQGTAGTGAGGGTDVGRRGGGSTVVGEGGSGVGEGPKDKGRGLASIIRTRLGLGGANSDLLVGSDPMTSMAGSLPGARSAVASHTGSMGTANAGQQRSGRDTNKDKPGKYEGRSAGALAPNRPQGSPTSAGSDDGSDAASRIGSSRLSTAEGTDSQVFNKGLLRSRSGATSARSGTGLLIRSGVSETTDITVPMAKSGSGGVTLSRSASGGEGDSTQPQGTLGNALSALFTRSSSGGSAGARRRDSDPSGGLPSGASGGSTGRSALAAFTQSGVNHRNDYMVGAGGVSPQAVRRAVPSLEGAAARLMTQVEKAYAFSRDRFPTQGMAQLAAGQFYKHLHNTRYMEMVTIYNARRVSSAPDVRFFVYQRSRQLRETRSEDGDAGGGQGLTVIDRILFEQKWKTVREAEQACLQSLVSLWDEVRPEVPHLHKLEPLASMYWEAMYKALAAYRALLQLQSNNAKLLRAYAHFLTHFLHDSSRARQMLNKAATITAALTDAQHHIVEHLVMFRKSSTSIPTEDERVAVLKVDGERHSIGTLLHVNSAACRMFGRTRSQMLGRNMDMLLPPPIAAAHDTFLKSYARTGRGCLVNQTFYSFFADSGGNVVPCRVSIAEAPPSDTDTAPSFVGHIQRLEVAEDYVIFGPAHTGYRMLAASLPSHLLLGTNSQKLADGNISVCKHFEQVDTEHARILKIGGKGDDRQKDMGLAELAAGLLSGSLTEQDKGQEQGQKLPHGQSRSLQPRSTKEGMSGLAGLADVAAKRRVRGGGRGGKGGRFVADSRPLGVQDGNEGGAKSVTKGLRRTFHSKISIAQSVASAAERRGRAKVVSLLRGDEFRSTPVAEAQNSSLRQVQAKVQTITLPVVGTFHVLIWKPMANTLDAAMDMSMLGGGAAAASRMLSASQIFQPPAAVAGGYGGDLKKTSSFLTHGSSTSGGGFDVAGTPMSGGSSFMGPLSSPASKRMPGQGIRRLALNGSTHFGSKRFGGKRLAAAQRAGHRELTEPALPPRESSLVGRAGVAAGAGPRRRSVNIHGATAAGGPAGGGRSVTDQGWVGVGGKAPRPVPAGAPSTRDTSFPTKPPSGATGQSSLPPSPQAQVRSLRALGERSSERFARSGSVDVDIGDHETTGPDKQLPAAPGVQQGDDNAPIRVESPTPPSPSQEGGRGGRRRSTSNDSAVSEPLTPSAHGTFTGQAGAATGSPVIFHALSSDGGGASESKAQHVTPPQGLASSLGGVRPASIGVSPPPTSPAAPTAVQGRTPLSLFGSPAAIFQGRPRASSAAAASTGGSSEGPGIGEGSARSSMGGAGSVDFGGDLRGDWMHDTAGLDDAVADKRQDTDVEQSQEFNPFSDSAAGGQRMSAADKYNAKRRAARLRLMGGGSSGTEGGATFAGAPADTQASSNSGLAADATFSLRGTQVPSQSLVGAFFTMGPRADAAASMIAHQQSSLASMGPHGSIIAPPSLSVGTLPGAPDFLPATTGRNRSRSNTVRSAMSGGGPMSPSGGPRELSTHSLAGGGGSGPDDGRSGSLSSAGSSVVGSSMGGGSDDSDGGLLGGTDEEYGGGSDHEGGDMQGPDAQRGDDTFDLALKAVDRTERDAGGAMGGSTSQQGLLDDSGPQDHAGHFLAFEPPLSSPNMKLNTGVMSSEDVFSFGDAGSRGDLLSASSSPNSSDMALAKLRKGTSQASTTHSDTDGGMFGRLGSPSASRGSGGNSRGPSRLGLAGQGGAVPRTGRKRRTGGGHSGGTQAAKSTFKEGLRTLRRLAGQATMLSNTMLFRVIASAVAAYGIMTLPMILALEVERQFVMPLLASLDVGAGAVAASAANVVGLSLIPDMLNPMVGAWAWSRPENDIILDVFDGNISLQTALQTPSWWNNGLPFATSQLLDLKEAAIGVGRSRLDVLGVVAERLDTPLRTPIILEDGVPNRFYTFLSTSGVLGVSVLDLINTPAQNVSRTQSAASIILNNRRALSFEYIRLLQGYADVYMSYLNVYGTFFDVGCYAAIIMILGWVLTAQYSLQVHLNRTMISSVRNFALVPKALVYQQQKTSKRRLVTAEKQLRKENGEDEEEEGMTLSMKAQEAIRRSNGVAGLTAGHFIGSAYAGSSSRSGMLSSHSSRGKRRMSTGLFSAGASSTRNLSLVQSSVARDLSAASFRGGGGRRQSNFSAAPSSGRRQISAATPSPRTPEGRNSRRAQLGGLQGATARMKSSRALLALPATGEFHYATKTHLRTWRRTANIFFRVGMIAWLLYMKRSFVSKAVLGLQQLANIHAASFSSSRNVAAVHSILNSAFANKTTGEINVALQDATEASSALFKQLDFIAFGSGGELDQIVGRTMEALPVEAEYDKARRLLTSNACEDFVVPPVYNSLVNCQAFVQSLNAEGRGLVGVAEEMRNLVSRLVATARVFPLAGKADNERGIVDVREIVASASAGNADSAANRVGLLKILQSDMPYLRQQLQRVAREIEAGLERDRGTVISGQTSFIVVSFTVGFLFLLLEARQSTVAARRAYAVRLLIMAVPKQMAFAVRPLLLQYHDFTEVGDASLRRPDGAGVIPGAGTPTASASTARRGDTNPPNERTGMLSNTDRPQ